ncbi:aminodeoxychorismate lyase [Sclerotinia borealis F-4128]|uniref:Aminodeoxychorismate lyase n=1 Tax=Sclerotinia borealis (strain F-4128) TaxID=1432307 RepID=W9CAM0_SCLBF|nr:aminodeoxychorismate lyase [Sclerotinia borealis F-4128]
MSTSTDPDFQLFTSLRYDPILLQSPRNIQSWPSSPSSPSSSPFPCPFYMLPHHRDRLLSAAIHFNWPKAISVISGPTGFQNLLDILTQNIDIRSPTPLRVRVVLDHQGTLTIESNATPPVSLSNLFPGRLPPPSSSPLPPPPQVSPLTGGLLSLSPTATLPSDPTLTLPPWPLIPDSTPTSPSPYTTFKTTTRTPYNLARLRAHIHHLSDTREVLLSTPSRKIMEGSLTTPFFYRGGKWVTPAARSGGQLGTTRRWGLEMG